jgi:peptide/nickel transport system permease protein
MSEQRPEETAAPVVGQKPLAGGELAGVGRDYWSIIWRQFRKHRFAVVGLVLVVVVFIVGVFAPFIANKYPYYWYTPEEGLSFPVLKALTDEDLLLILGFTLVLLVPVTRRLLRRTSWQFWDRHEMRRAMLVNAVLFAVAAGLLALGPVRTGRVVKQQTMEVNGRTLTVSPERDFRRELADGATAKYLFPPVRYAPTDLGVGKMFEPPSERHWFGTDQSGRSIASRVVYGSRVAISVGFISVAISLVIGLLIGGVSAYFGGWVDLILQRLVEVVMCFPALFLILMIVAIYGPKLWIIMMAMGFVSWTGTARLIRAGVLQIRALDYITAARAQGLGSLYIIVRHALPNALAPVLVTATFAIAGAITTEAGLSFLGLGDPDSPSWGQLLNEAREVATTSPSHVIIPGVAIALAVLAYNLVGEGLRDAVDPKLKV